jgi:hypothetical protein
MTSPSVRDLDDNSFDRSTTRNTVLPALRIRVRMTVNDPLKTFADPS